MPKYKTIKFFILIFSLLTLYSACIKSYSPSAITAANSYLVVDGFINTGINSSTSFVLSRSRNLADTSSFIPELNAQVILADSNGTTYSLIDSNGNGKYTSAQLSLNPNDHYRILITTSNGHQYQSAFVSPKNTPPIDSVTWRQNPLTWDLTINVNTHDPFNNTTYYRWDYSETWQHNAPEIAYWVLVNGYVIPLDADWINDPRQIYQCWTTAPAKHITVGTSLGLSQDVISMQPITIIPLNDERITVRYSILVNQYAISQDAYNYWVLIQKNSQNLGGLFDLIPSQLNSNIKCTTNPNEPVIGYVSASTLQQQRLFITNAEVGGGWIKQEPYNECSTLILPTDTSNFQIYNYPDTSYTPWYFTGNFVPALVVVKKYCVDCRVWGGTNSKPPFW
ncbi:MAG: DUF4249 domain-containing protein [Bacteroidetes bacterium]|nr:DUF4249 domain-containing protein [Bacteroidota bacterium]